LADLPTTLDDVKKDAKMTAAYLAYAKRRQTLNEIMFAWNKGNNYELFWKKYISPGSSDEVNVSAPVITAARALADRSDWSNPAWGKIMKKGQSEVMSALTGDIGTFVASAEFKAYLIKEKMGDPAKAAKILGISDPKKLRAMMEAKVMGDDKTAKRLWDEIAKKEKAIDKYETIIKNLEKSGLV
jgi:hypothetical protein